MPMVRQNLVCAVEGCERGRHARGLCRAHYSRFMRGASLSRPIKKHPGSRPPARASDSPLPGETWRPIPGYEGRYDASSLGRIRRAETGRVLRQRKNSAGYLRVNLTREGTMRTEKSHRLIAAAFPQGNGPVVLHLNDDPGDNRASNLVWGTQKQNIRQSVRAGRFGGETRPNAKLSDDAVRAIRQDTRSSTAVAEQYGVHPTLIQLVRRRLRWGHVK